MSDIKDALARQGAVPMGGPPADMIRACAVSRRAGVTSCARTISRWTSARRAQITAPARDTRCWAACRWRTRRGLSCCRGRNRGDVPDVAVGEAGTAQRLAIVLLDLRGFARDFTESRAWRGGACSTARRDSSSPSVRRAPDRRTARAPRRRAPPGNSSSGSRGYGDRDHLALQFGEAGGRQHQVVVSATKVSSFGTSKE